MLANKIVNLEDVVAVLLEKFPNKLPTTPTTESELSVLIGQQQVISYLISVIEAIEDKSHESKPRKLR